MLFLRFFFRKSVPKNSAHGDRSIYEKSPTSAFQCSSGVATYIRDTGDAKYKVSAQLMHSSMTYGNFVIFTIFFGKVFQKVVHTEIDRSMKSHQLARLSVQAGLQHI